MRSGPDYVCRHPRVQLLVSSLPSTLPHLCLVRHEVIGLAMEHFRMQMAAFLAAQATLNCHRLERELVQANRDASPALLALDDELLSACRSLKHSNRIGEEITKVECLLWIHPGKPL